MKHVSLYVMTIVCLFCSLSSSAQNDPIVLITGEFKNLNIEQFVRQLEQATGDTYYYNPKDFDSLVINFSAKEKPLAEVLATAFANTDYQFAIDESKQVFLTKGRGLKTTLFEGIASGGDAGNDSTQTNRLGNAGYEADKPVQRSSLENKLYEIGDRSLMNVEGTAILDGYLQDGKTGEAIIGASIYIDKLKVNISTDQNGYYTLTLPKGQHTLSIQGMGIKDTRRQVVLHADGKMNIEVQQQIMTLKNVTMSAQKINNIRSAQMGVQKIDIKTIKQVPVVFGEADVLRVVLTLPGVKSVGEASTGLNVRGGAADQNLILFNDATIYNPAHFFGLFSAFNPEIVKDVELYKSSVPAKFGGRLSSVIDITGREGNKKKVTGSAGIGLLTSRFNLEGPLINDKSSFILGGRTTYAKWLLNILPDQYKNSRASFNDFNLHISHEFTEKTTLYVTGYMSNDRFNLNSDTFYSYGNKNISLKLKHFFNNKLNALFTVGYDRYDYNITSESNEITAYKLGFDINQTYLKTHFNYNLSVKHRLEFGLNSIYYKLHPGSYLPVGGKSLVLADTVATEQALESAIYLSDKYNITPELFFDAGVRFSFYNYLGPQTVNTYAPGIPRTETNMLESKSYTGSNFIKTYGGPEIRVSMRYAFSDSFSIKAGYNTQRQYIHSMSNVTSMAPTDIWKLSDPNIKPQFGDQVSLGLYKNFRANTIETSLEVYYKNIKNYLDYKSGAQLIMNDHVETDVFTTRGKAYGVEVMVRKPAGKLNGWISYTYSRTQLKMDDPIAGEVINKGNYYPANYDKPHDVTMIANYRLSHRFSLSLNTTYSTGRPITLPIGSFTYGSSIRTLYGERNAYRIPDYFRTDFSMNIEGNHKVKQWTHNSWTIGVYNLTGRKNPYSVYFLSENGVIKGYKLSIFGSAIPYVNFNIRF
ncbi:MAG: carboxypeptidase-like regulatory domain-containing protein [Bacteroidota bacterium]